MRTEATVVEIRGNRAIVTTERLSACEGCHKATEGEGCSVCTLMGGNRTVSAEAENPLGARVGDRVMIESRTGRMLWYAALVFLVPIVLAIVGYLLADLWLPNTVWRAILPISAFVGTFFGIFVYSKSVQRKRCDVKITEIVRGDGQSV
jgi:sigma-E factor negative regulatory protein RseC